MRISEKLDIELVDSLIRKYADGGWAIHRRTLTYFTATKDGTHCGVTAHNGRLIASKTEVVDITTSTDRLLAWINEKG